MLRYVAVITPNKNSPDRAREHSVASAVRSSLVNWKCLFENESMLVLSKNAALKHGVSYPIANNGGVILGQLFRKNEQIQAEKSAFAHLRPESSNIVTSGGRSLIGEYWGRYVAFIYDELNRASYVLRDPSGGILCNRISLGDTTVFFSHVQDIVDIQQISLSINWSFVLADLTNLELVNEKTGFQEVQELEPGECHVLSTASDSRHYYWRPADVYASGRIENEAEARKALRKTAQYCIGSWASSYSSIVHNLSGGLDSAIVLACIASASRKPKVACLNYYTSAEDGDERRYARLSAEKAGYELFEVAMPGDTASIQQLVANTPLLERPSTNIYAAPVDKMQMEFALKHEAEAFTTGEGGDHVFYAMKLDLVAADFARKYAVSPKLFQAVANGATLTKKSFWAVMGTAIKHGLMRRTWDPDDLFPAQAPQYLSADSLAEIPDGFSDHPWLTDCSKIPPGKLAQIYLLPKVLHRHPSFGRVEVADVIHPLFSQPLVELCLRIPSYILTANGRNRNLARTAFAEIIPSEIANRQTKGWTSTYFTRMYVEGLPFIREFLLDGIFAQEAFVEIAELDKFLTTETISRPGNVRPIFKLIALEAWLRRWSELRKSRAA